MVAKPDVSVAAEEPLADAHGQFWSPAKVTLTWPPTGKLPAPAVQVSLIAPIRGQMTVDELGQAHIQGAHDVLNAVLLSLEGVPAANPAKQKSQQR